jgi:hypothetical protein
LDIWKLSEEPTVIVKLYGIQFSNDKKKENHCKLGEVYILNYPARENSRANLFT